MNMCHSSHMVKCGARGTTSRPPTSRSSDPPEHFPSQLHPQSVFDASADLRDMQIAANHADPPATMRYDNPRELHQTAEKPQSAGRICDESLQVSVGMDPLTCGGCLRSHWMHDPHARRVPPALRRTLSREA